MAGSLDRLPDDRSDPYSLMGGKETGRGGMANQCLGKGRAMLLFRLGQVGHRTQPNKRIASNL
jgi:hypothetical protein|uniref:Uncharacterized protein n=1 Tax=Picea glauca TaxID=3330 RepID=A0A101LUW9_PICGL|nr:hypothetical protein ABT39_MTgene2365 [Picea glauca]QHR92255.1 hypothetical protein Q903MT_gene6294 [Picea sitchensis]